MERKRLVKRSAETIPVLDLFAAKEVRQGKGKALEICPPSLPRSFALWEQEPCPYCTVSVKVTIAESAPEAPEVPGKAPGPLALETVTANARLMAVHWRSPES